jgi:hypothetical protein
MINYNMTANVAPNSASEGSKVCQYLASWLKTQIAQAICAIQLTNKLRSITASKKM